LTIKAASDGSRTFTGIATTPSTDRMGDVVEPEGARMRLPLPLLLHHNPAAPVGVVEAADVTPRGITVRCRIAQPEEAGVLRERCDEAWHSIRAGVIRGLSIGFRALEDGVEKLRSGGLRFTSLEILELSLVSIPANQDCTISAVKRYAAGDRARRGAVQLITAQHRAATGRKGVQLITAGTAAKLPAQRTDPGARAREMLRELDALHGQKWNPSGRQALQLAACGTFTLLDQVGGLAERVEALERQK